jgi:hypothetical protein
MGSGLKKVPDMKYWKTTKKMKDEMLVLYMCEPETETIMASK